MRNYPNCLLDPEQCVFLFIDQRPQDFALVEGVSRVRILDRTAALAQTAGIFHVPCLLTAMEKAAGPMALNLREHKSDITLVMRSGYNGWEEPELRAALERTGRRRLILAGVWTEGALCFLALCAAAGGYEVFVAADACGGTSRLAHETAIARMIQAGIKPVTWPQVILEFQRDPAYGESYAAAEALISRHTGLWSANP